MVVAIGAKVARLLRYEVDELSAEQADDESGGGRNADPTAVDGRVVDVHMFGAIGKRMTLAVWPMREPRQDLVALRFERAFVEVGIRFGACGVREASSAAFWS